ncbi:hypothetical protein AB447_224385 [Bacillus glycinifermentans]|uniref:Uncharacterized protein n=1 Tax=Bacillus glycinifermentans TaxID=1664069 RepID=A0A0T6BKA6_9BACI|nr:hypothetical protein AB447_224385 [Bacillus glycinifermentans]
MDIFKKIIAGFLICHLTFLSLIYLNLYRVGVFENWRDSFNYAFILFSYIPILALIEYFLFHFIFNKLFKLQSTTRIVLVTILTVSANSFIIYLQLKDFTFAGMTAISTLLMSLVLPFIKTKRTDS